MIKVTIETLRTYAEQRRAAFGDDHPLDGVTCGQFLTLLQQADEMTARVDELEAAIAKYKVATELLEPDQNRY